MVISFVCMRQHIYDRKKPNIIISCQNGHDRFVGTLKLIFGYTLLNK